MNRSADWLRFQKWITAAVFSHVLNTAIIASRRAVNLVVIQLKMIHSTLQILWMVFPLGSWIANLFLPRRLHPVLLYFLVVTVGYLLLVTSVFAMDAHLESELYKFDLDGDGGFDDSELTPAAQQAMDDFTHDTGRTFAPVFGAPITGIWVLLNLAVLYCGEWILRWLTTKRQQLTKPFSNDKTDITNTDQNPYKPPTAR